MAGVTQGFLQTLEGIERNRSQVRAAQHKVQIASLVAPAIHAAAVSPYLYAGDVLAQQAFDLLPMPGIQVESEGHSFPWANTPESALASSMKLGNAARTSLA